MKKIILLILNFCLITSAYAQSSFRLGVNLERTGAFVNVINNTYRISKATGYDSLGWSLSDFDLVLLDGRPATEWTGVIDDPEQYRINYSGRYKASFKGLATVSVTGTSVTIENRRYDTLSNTSFFDVVVGGYPNANHGMVFLSFTNTKRTLNSSANSGLTKLKVNRPGYELNTDKIFTDEFINLCKAADFACYRYYGMQNIWDGEPVYPAKTTWDKRKKPNDASQEPLKGIGKIDGWCWEYIVELANILKKDIWINIHISCDSAYVLTLAQYLKDNLDGNINIYVENSNEVWNASQVTQGLYNKAQADFYKINFDQNYARRVVELSNLFAQVYGANEINKKIRVILASQHSWSARSDTHLNYIKSAFGEPKNYIYALSPALYFGSTKATSTDPLVINDGMIEDINDQITNAQAGTYRLNHINKAKQWGFTGGCTSYEGGPGLPASGGTANLGNQILANRTEKMGDIIKKSYIEGWKDLDGGLALYFTLFSGYNRYGCWGITDDYSNPDRNYKMKAIREIISGYSDGVNENNKEENFGNIYPNPARDYVFVSDFEGEIKIFDLIGNLVLKAETKKNLKIDVSGLDTGLYFVKINNKMGKFIKL